MSFSAALIVCWHNLPSKHLFLSLSSYFLYHCPLRPAVLCPPNYLTTIPFSFPLLSYFFFISFMNSIFCQNHSYQPWFANYPQNYDFVSFVLRKERGSLYKLLFVNNVRMGMSYLLLIVQCSLHHIQIYPNQVQFRRESFTEQKLKFNQRAVFLAIFSNKQRGREIIAKFRTFSVISGYTIFGSNNSFSKIC